MKFWEEFAGSVTNLKSGTASARSLGVRMRGIVNVRIVLGWSNLAAERKCEPKGTW